MAQDHQRADPAILEQRHDHHRSLRMVEIRPVLRQEAPGLRPQFAQSAQHRPASALPAVVTVDIDSLLVRPQRQEVAALDLQVLLQQMGTCSDDGLRLRQRPERLIQRQQEAVPRLPQVLLGDVDAVHEDAVDRTVRATQRLVHEIDEDFLQAVFLAAPKRQRHCGTDMGLAAAVDLVEDVDDALAHQFRQRCPDRPSGQFPVPNEPMKTIVEIRDPMVGTAQNADERRRQGKGLAQAMVLRWRLPLGLGPLLP
jgi:hypothetical protein